MCVCVLFAKWKNASIYQKFFVDIIHNWICWMLEAWMGFHEYAGKKIEKRKMDCMCKHHLLVADAAAIVNWYDFILCFGAHQFHRNHIQKQSFRSWCQAMRIMFMLNAQFHDLLNMLNNVCVCAYCICVLGLCFGYYVAADSTNERTCTNAHGQLANLFYVEVISPYILIAWCVHCKKNLFATACD